MSPFLYEKSNPNSDYGFSLTELLVALAILAIAISSILVVFVGFLKHFEQSDDVVAAQQRAESVLAYLQRPIQNAGLGLPSSSDQFKECFKDSGLPWANWDGAVSTALSFKELRVVYAVPSGAIVSSEVDFTKDQNTNVFFVSGYSPPLAIGTNPSKTNGWLTFPTGGFPCQVISKGPPLTIQPKGSTAVARFDELFYLKAIRAYVGGASIQTKQFYVEEPGASGAIPLVDGVLDARFDYDATKGVLTMWLLTRGNRRYDTPQPFADKTYWDSSKFGDVPIDATHYRLKVTRTIWKVRN